MISTRFALSFVLALGLAPLTAQADVFKCLDANGKVSYTNDRGGKGCKALTNEGAVSTISMRTPATGAFPRVTEDVQRARDAGRREVLEGELAGEQSALDEARKVLAEQETTRNGGEKNYQKVLDRLQPYKEDVERRERNVEALNKELSGLR
ncbi:MAG: DUF4124 domain-containing protein [Azoarcus sp.]|jgi:hypothetical protein|nr:DUF4124 domain-containing protein [Azoarcus sp.]